MEKINPDIDILDLLMPGIDGIETAKRVLAVHPDQRIIILSADLRGDHQSLAIQAGAYGYVRKDASPPELVDAIQKDYEEEPSISPSSLRLPVRTHISRALQNLGLRNRVDAMLCGWSRLDEASTGEDNW